MKQPKLLKRPVEEVWMDPVLDDIQDRIQYVLGKAVSDYVENGLLWVSSKKVTFVISEPLSVTYSEPLLKLLKEAIDNHRVYDGICDQKEIAPLRKILKQALKYMDEKVEKE